MFSCVQKWYFFLTPSCAENVLNELPGVFGFVDVDTPGAVVTMDKIFLAGLSRGKDREFLGHRPLISTSPVKYANKYVWETYGQVDERRRQVGSGLSHLFANGTLGGGEYRTVGIWSQNRPGTCDRFSCCLTEPHPSEWQIIEIALHSYNMATVSLYDTLGQESVGEESRLIHRTMLTFPMRRVHVRIDFS